MNIYQIIYLVCVTIALLVGSVLYVLKKKLDAYSEWYNETQVDK